MVVEAETLTTCNRCNLELSKWARREFCRKCQRWLKYHNDPQRAREVGRVKYFRYLTKNRARNKRNITRYYALWHGGNLLKFYQAKYAGKIAEVIGDAWLDKLGFTNRIRLSDLYPSFPFDIIAVYNGERVFVDITADLSRGKINRRKSLAKILGHRFYILHVSYDGSKYQLNEITENVKSSSVKVSTLRKQFNNISIPIPEPRIVEGANGRVVNYL